MTIAWQVVNRNGNPPRLFQWLPIYWTRERAQEVADGFPKCKLNVKKVKIEATLLNKSGYGFPKVRAVDIHPGWPVLKKKKRRRVH